MAKPNLPDINTLIMAGIDPKTGLPIRSKDGSKDIKKDIRTSLRVLDEQNAINRFVWHNLPYGLTGQMIERILYYKGQAALFYLETEDKFFFLPYALDGTIDVYGRFKGITPLPFAGGTTANTNGKPAPFIQGLTLRPVYDVILPEDLTLSDLTESCVLLHDYTPQLSQLIIPRQILQEPIIDVMSDCVPFMRTALLCGTGVDALRVGDQSEQSNVAIASESVNRAALRGEKWIGVVGTLDFQPLTNGNVSRAEEYLLAMQALDNLRLSQLGLDNGGLFQKKAHMLEAESERNSGNVGIVAQDGLTRRQHFCDVLNSIWARGTWVESSETFIGIDKDLSGEISDTTNEGGIDYAYDAVRELPE